MDVEKFRNSALDEEEVVFGIGESSNTENAEVSVKDAVERWERELEAALNLGNATTPTPTPTTRPSSSSRAVLTSISLDGNVSVSSSSSSSSRSRSNSNSNSKDIYEDEYNLYDHNNQDENNNNNNTNQSFEMELNALAYSETLLTEELSRLDYSLSSPLSSSHDQGQPTCLLRDPSRRSPDPPVLLRLPDPEEQHESIDQYEICEEPSLLQPLSPSSSRTVSLPVSLVSSPRTSTSTSTSRRSRRRRSIWRSRCCCSKLVLVRIFGVVVSTAFMIAAILLPLYLRPRTQQDLQQHTLHIVDVLIAHEISTREDLERFGSPQQRAAEWISEDQVRQQQGYWWSRPLSSSIIGGETSVSSSDLLDRYVLAVLYFSLGGGGGGDVVDTSWPDDLNFLSADHVCTWNTKGQQQQLLAASNDNNRMNKQPSPAIVGVHDCQEDEFGALIPTGIALCKCNMMWIDRLSFKSKKPNLTLSSTYCLWLPVYLLVRPSFYSISWSFGCLAR
jgi:hypothetical protein